MAMLGIGGGLAAAGLIGAYASGSMSPSQRVGTPTPRAQAYQWGGSTQALGQENKRLTGYEDQGRALSLSARGDQAALAEQYKHMAAGNGPSMAEKQMQRGLAESTAQAQAQAAATRGGGGNALLAQRNAQRTAADMSLAVNRDAGMARTAEQMGAMNAQAALYGQMRGADQQGYQADMGARYGLQGQQLQANMAQDQARMGAEQWAAGQNAAIEAADKQRKAALWGGLTGAGGSMMGMGIAGGGKLWAFAAIRWAKMGPIISS